jgi:hypothetical protein
MELRTRTYGTRTSGSSEFRNLRSNFGRRWPSRLEFNLCWLLRAPVDLRRDDVVVMETTEHRESDDRCAAGERTPVGWNRNPLRYPLVVEPR